MAEERRPAQVFAEFQRRVRVLEHQEKELRLILQYLTETIGNVLTTQDISAHSRQLLAIDADKAQEVVADLQRRIEELEVVGGGRDDTL